MKNKVKKPSQTYKFKEPKLKPANTYSSRRLVRRIADWVKDYYRVIIPAILCIILIIVVICMLLNKKEKNDIPEEVVDAALNEPVKDEYIVIDAPLDAGGNELINQFVLTYYQAMADGNTTIYTSMRDNTDDTNRISMEKKSNYIENYQNIMCYSKPGPIDNTYIVYVYYEVKFFNIDNLAPGLNTLYLCTNDAGELFVGDNAEDDKVSDYIHTVSAQDDVADLFNMVQVKYAEVVDGDETLKTFLDNLSVQLKEDVGEALAELIVDGTETDVADSATDTDEDTTTDTPADGSEVEPADPVAVVEMVKTNSKVNVRSEASTDSQKLGTAAKGEVYELLETLDNGWSKISYNGGEAYIMTSYLEAVLDAIGSVTVLENVNVRASSSPNATKLGVAYAGEVYELLEEVGNGWSKIKYNGETAYIKSEYLQKN